MIIKLESQTRLVVSLDKNDLEELGTTCEELLHPRLATLRILERILRIGSLDTGFSPDSDNLMVQIQAGSETCRIIFSALPESLEKTSPTEPVVFAFDTIEDLLDATSGIFEIHSHRIYKSSLYRMEGGYRLLIRTLDAADGPVNAHMEQYGRRVGQGELAAAFLEEHAQLVIEGDAIDKLAALSTG